MPFPPNFRAFPFDPVSGRHNVETVVGGTPNYAIPQFTNLENFPRVICDSNAITITSGTIYHVGHFTIPTGFKVSNIGFWSGSQAAVTPTHYWAGLSSINGVGSTTTILATSADKTTTAWAANALTGFALSSPYQPSNDTAVLVFICVVATTPPNLSGRFSSASPGVATGPINQAIPFLMSSNTAQAGGPPAVNSTTAALSAGIMTIPYVVLY